MASFVPAKKNTALTFYIGLPDAADSRRMKANPTLAAGDVKVAIDDGAPANLGTLPVVDADFTKRIKVVTTAGEMNGDNITFIFSDQTDPPEWCDVVVNIPTATKQIDDLATQTSVDTVDDFLDTEIAAIKAKTDNLPSDPADASVVAGLIAGVEAKVDTVDTVVDAIKLKTDNLPSDPADQSLIIAATDALATLIADLPTNAELATALGAADDATLAAIAALDTKIDTIDTVADGIAVQVAELWQMAGLDMANPATFEPATISVGTIVIDITGDGETTTTLTRSA